MKEPFHKLYVGNLEYRVREAQLRRAFDGFNLRSVRVVTRPDGRAKGFAFIEFADVGSATRALHAKNKTKLDGRMMFVDFAKAARNKSDTEDDNTKSRTDSNNATAGPATLWGILRAGSSEDIKSNTSSQGDSPTQARVQTTGRSAWAQYAAQATIKAIEAEHNTRTADAAEITTRTPSPDRMAASSTSSRPFGGITSQRWKETYKQTGVEDNWAGGARKVIGTQQTMHGNPVQGNTNDFDDATTGPTTMWGILRME